MPTNQSLHGKSRVLLTQPVLGLNVDQHVGIFVHGGSSIRDRRQASLASPGRQGCHRPSFRAAQGGREQTAYQLALHIQCQRSRLCCHQQGLCSDPTRRAQILLQVGGSQLDAHLGSASTLDRHRLAQLDRIASHLHRPCQQSFQRTPWIPERGHRSLVSVGPGRGQQTRAALCSEPPISRLGPHRLGAQPFRPPRTCRRIVPPRWLARRQFRDTHHGQPHFGLLWCSARCHRLSCYCCLLVCQGQAARCGSRVGRDRSSHSRRRAKGPYSKTRITARVLPRLRPPLVGKPRLCRDLQPSILRLTRRRP